VDVLKAHLIEQLHIDERRIAVATGKQRDLEGVDLFRRDCPIDFVITVEALKEGWDCSFAYVFCTAQNIRSAKDMEQLLGRVLRMPYATRRTSERLNRAYAHVCGTRTAQVANQLADRLISMGFERMAAVQAVQPALDDLFEPRPAGAVVESEFEATPAAAQALAAALPEQVRVEPGEVEGTMRVTVRGAVEAAVSATAIAAAPKGDREKLQEQLQNHDARVLAAAAPSERGEVFAGIPQLVLPMQGALTLYEPELLAEFVDYSLTGLPADLPGLTREEDRHPYLIDIEQGRLGVREDTAQYGLPLDADSDAIRREDVIRALDRRLRQDAILQPDMIAWLGRLLDGLARGGFDLVYVARHLNVVAAAAAMRLKELLAGQKERAFQQSLLPGEHRARLDNHTQFRFDPASYPARWLYAGRYRFNKHYYPLPGELKSELEAEETACAIEIDSLPQVRRWIRNLERQPDSAFWLPTSTDRFYPDFVAELEDGRLIVVEYKGGDRYSNDDSREKRDIGQAWAGASDGRCVFLMATDAATAGRPVGAQLRTALTGMRE
jgi:type III restriction enzyme